jgi:hypothetical protein
MNNIPKEIRAKLKRLSPYIGDVPESVRQKAREFWSAPRCNVDEDAGWHWDNGSGFYQWELELCDIDADHIDPQGYVALRPLGQGVTLEFVIVDSFHLKNLIFQTVQEAQRYLDTLLAADTPPLVEFCNGRSLQFKIIPTMAHQGDLFPGRMDTRMELAVFSQGIFVSSSE